MENYSEYRQRVAKAAVKLWTLSPLEPRPLTVPLTGPVVTARSRMERTARAVEKISRLPEL